MVLVSDVEQPETSMSSDAFELINCFYNGIDLLVRELAEQFAVEEGAVNSAGVVLIEQEHVEKAGYGIISKLKPLFKNNELPEEFTIRLKGMSDRFASKLDQP